MGGMRRIGPVPSRVMSSRRSPDRLWMRACQGLEPAEALDRRDREDLVVQLLEAGWSVPAIAEHTLMTEYTTARIAARFTISTAEVAA